MNAGLDQPFQRWSWSGWALFLAAIALLLALVAGGYGSFRAFARAPDPGAYSLLFMAVAAGVASFFSPCAFPLLPGYLSFYYESEKGQGDAGGGARPLKLGLAAALGVSTFNLILGLTIALMGAGVAAGLSISDPDPSRFVRLFRGAVGIALLVLGIVQLVGWSLKPALADALAYATRPRRVGGPGSAASLYLYGLGYNAAGMGCTGPILAGLMVLALGSGGFTSALAAFGLFALTMGALMLIVSGLIAVSQHAMITRLKAAAPRIKAASSVLLVAVGSFNLITAIDQSLFLRLLFP